MFEIMDMHEYHLENVCNLRNYYIRTSSSNLSHDEEEPAKWAFKLDISDKKKKKYVKLVATLDGNVVGYAMLSKYRRGGYEKTAELSIYIDTNAKGIGVGTALMEKMIERVESEKQFHLIVSVITDENKLSINFHKKFGFEEVGVLKDAGYKFDKYYDVVFMSKKFNLI